MKKIVVLLVAAMVFIMAVSSISFASSNNRSNVDDDVDVDNNDDLTEFVYEESTFYISAGDKAIAVDPATLPSGTHGFFVQDGKTYFAISYQKDAVKDLINGPFMYETGDRWEGGVYSLHFTADMKDVIFIEGGSASETQYREEILPLLDGYLIASYLVFEECTDPLELHNKFYSEMVENGSGFIFSLEMGDPGSTENPGAS